jgi:hypothetical protein
VDLLRSTQLLVETAVAQRSTRLIMGNSALPTRGSPLTGQPIYHATNTVSASSFHSLLQLIVHTNTINGARLRRQTIQHSTPSFSSHSADNRHTPTDMPADRLYIYREQRNICRRYCPCTSQKLSTMTALLLHNTAVPCKTLHA